MFGALFGNPARVVITQPRVGPSGPTLGTTPHEINPVGVESKEAKIDRKSVV